MDDKDVLEGYYCYRCKKDAECRLSTWIDSIVTSIPPHRVLVRVKAQCVDCDAVLVSGEEIIELY